MEKKNRHTEIQVYLAFKEFDIHPSELSEELGLEPDKVLVKGEINPKNNNPYNFNTWVVYSSADRNEDLDTHIDKLINKITPYYDKFREVSKRYPPTLECVIELYNGDNPPLGFNSETIKYISQLNANIDIDLYNIF